MNRLTTEDRVRILAVLCEGVGINAACRDTGASKNTVLKLVADVGQACALYQDQVMRNLKITQLQVVEIWSFIGEMAKNVPANAEPTLARGDCYTFIALDPVTKLMPCWLVGFRGYGSTDAFIEDLASRLADSRQLPSDDFAAYPAPDARDCVSNVNYGDLLTKSHAASPAAEEATRPDDCTESISCTKPPKVGIPFTEMISTHHARRANEMMRINIRRFTRPTNGFSKKIENHLHAVSFFVMVHNFVERNGSTNTTPAVAAGVATVQWSIEDILLMADTVTFGQPT